MPLDIMSLFRPATPSTPPQVNAPGNQQTPGQQTPGTHASNATAPNGVVPAQAAQNPAPAAQVTPTATPSPLDSFKDVWQTPNTPPADPTIFGDLDPKKLMESARQVDFSKVITPEQLTAIGQGGESAVKAFGAALNSVAQTVYGQSAMATTQIVEQALKKSNQSYETKMQEMVKKFSVNEGLQASNPLLTNPAVAPLVGALTEQLTRKNPNASSADIQAQVNDYFKHLGTAFAPQAPQQPGTKTKAEEDWDKFFS